MVIGEFPLHRKEILYVGDAPNDVKACRGCNIKIAAAAWRRLRARQKFEQIRPEFLFSSVPAFSDFLRKALE
jgi:phosphoglycolate phosphatase-like HAD superfamily hydrolase